MSKKHKKHRHPNQGRTKSAMNPAAPGRNGRQGGKQGRKTGMILVAALVVIAAVVAYALNVAKGPGERPGSAAADNPPLPTALAPPQPVLSTPLSGALLARSSGPRIRFTTPVYDFGQIKGGEVVKYTYVFTNVGQQVLEVTAVQASCGCTTAGDWSRQVQPGQTGSIPIAFNSGNFSGQVGKAITVTCNDSNQPTVVLQIQGTIWKPIDVTPQFAVINVTADSPSNATTVRIVNNEEAPLTLSTPEGNHPAFAAELRTNQPGKQFELVIRTVPPLPAGNVQGQFTLKTSSTNLPVISVSAWANVQPAVMVMPSPR